MKSMSDKELDEFFKSSLENFEKKPSAGSWKKIEQQLENKLEKKSVFSYWLAAASIVMVLGLSVKLYNSERQIIRLARPYDVVSTNDMADNVDKITSEKTVEEEITVAEDFDLEKSRKANEERFLAMVASYKVKDKKNEPTGATNPANNTVLYVLADEEIVETVELPNITVQNRDKDVHHQANNFVETEQQAYAQKSTDDTEPAGKEKIKSVGDIVNFLVSKIDKREDKIVHISKTEESEMEITAINLGLFKYKKEY